MQQALRAYRNLHRFVEYLLPVECPTIASTCTLPVRAGPTVASVHIQLVVSWAVVVFALLLRGSHVVQILFPRSQVLALCGEFALDLEWSTSRTAVSPIVTGRWHRV